MIDHINNAKSGLEKIKDGLAQLQSGPISFTLDCLFAAYRTLIEEYVPFKVGCRVELRDIPHPALDAGSDWYYCRHFMVPGNGATVRHVSVDSKGYVRYDIEFDRETWIDTDGKEQPVKNKHLFSFFEKELVGYQELAQ